MILNKVYVPMLHVPLSHFGKLSALAEEVLTNCGPGVPYILGERNIFLVSEVESEHFFFFQKEDFSSTDLQIFRFPEKNKFFLASHHEHKVVTNQRQACLLSS